MAGMPTDDLKAAGIDPAAEVGVSWTFIAEAYFGSLLAAAGFIPRRHRSSCGIVISI